MKVFAEKIRFNRTAREEQSVLLIELALAWCNPLHIRFTDSAFSTVVSIKDSHLSKCIALALLFSVKCI